MDYLEQLIKQTQPGQNNDLIILRELMMKYPGQKESLMNWWLQNQRNSLDAELNDHLFDTQERQNKLNLNNMKGMTPPGTPWLRIPGRPYGPST